jgi:hypothetical protein
VTQRQQRRSGRGTHEIWEGCIGENRNVRDVRGLEELLRSQDATRAIGGDSGSFAFAVGREDAMALELDSALMPEGFSQTVCWGGGTTFGETDDTVSLESSWKRETGRYWTIAALSALVAIVVAGGFTAGVGHHGLFNGSAHGADRTARPHGGTPPPVAAPTGPTAPGSLVGAVGSGALALGAPPAEARGSGSEPARRVTPSGRAATTGTLPAPSRAAPAVGSTSASSGPTAGNPAPSPPATVKSMVASVGSSVTGLANQFGDALPAAAPPTNAVRGAVNSVDQAVSAATL